MAKIFHLRINKTPFYENELCFPYLHKIQIKLDQSFTVKTGSDLCIFMFNNFILV